jgi:hypothetical protein
MAKSQSRAGGGVRSRVVTEKPVRYGDRARAMSPKGVSQIGTQRGDHATAKARLLKGDVESVRGPLKPAGGPGGVALGNEVAKNVGKGGAGTGRVLYGQSGSQQQYGAGAGKAPKAGGRDALEGE